ncbi:MAG: SulP family inorganic anion transporter [Myxococcota bacterium]
MPRLPLPPLSRIEPSEIPADFMAALAVCILAVPQGLAYATIAGLPPVMGLYAAAIPPIVGSLFRSSRHVVAGPTNALSLLVWAAVAGVSDDPVSVALTLALMVGVMQVAAGILRLGSVVDYISGPVVLGYITGAGVLIGIGQLHNVTATTGPRGNLLTTVQGWIPVLDEASTLAVGMTAGTVGVVILVRFISARLGRRIPAAVTAMITALIVNVALGLEDRGLRVLSDLSPIPSGFAMPEVPRLADLGTLLPFAVACTVLSLVESSAVARSIAARTGQRLDPSTEFVGQGMANLAAGFWGGYPVSGSLSRSALNERGGARSRLSGILSGVLMIGVLLVFGPTLDHTPIASLAGLLIVVAWDLVDAPRILRTMRASWGDALAFVVTVLATWIFSLDMAIYLGVAFSLVSFLQRARLLVVREMVHDEEGQWQERPADEGSDDGRMPHVRVLQIEGPLFFGAMGELLSSLEDVMRNRDVLAVVLRLKRAQGMDATAADALAGMAEAAKQRGQSLILVGLSPDMLEVLKRSDAALAFTPEHLLLANKTRFVALNEACRLASDYVANHAPSPD